MSGGGKGSGGAAREETDMYTGREISLVTEGGIGITTRVRAADYAQGTSPWIDRLDAERGAVFSSSYEYPGRYTRWDMALINPPLVLESLDRDAHIEALNDRGRLLLPAIEAHLRKLEDLESLTRDGDRLDMRIARPSRAFTEEERSRQPSIFSVIRAINALFACDDEHIGLYGAFGYDLAFQFEPIDLSLKRPDDQRDVVLYLPDEILLVDHYGRKAHVVEYEFTVDGESTEGLPRDGKSEAYRPAQGDPGRGDHVPGEYAELVRAAKDHFKRGDLFETVPGQTFYEACPAAPRPSPGGLRRSIRRPMASSSISAIRSTWSARAPEMYVRVSGGRRVETCPISGTIRRGKNAIEDEAQIRKLLNFRQGRGGTDDVFRRRPQRQEPHLRARLRARDRPPSDRDVFAPDPHRRSHRGHPARRSWTRSTPSCRTPGPSRSPARRNAGRCEFIERNEKSPRAWYGGAIGAVLFNGDMNTGLTLRTVRIKDGVAQIRAGATLLYDSIPEDEEAETELKAEAMRAAVREAGQGRAAIDGRETSLPGKGLKILLVDHEDSFVHTLANYFRQTGAEVVTYRSPVSDSVFHDVARIWWCCRPAPAARRISTARQPSDAPGPAACRSSASASAFRR
jgi:anthranilate synthase